MKYIFFGTPEFAALILGRLIDAGMVPTAVVTNPDRPVGRKKIVTAPAVKRCVMHKVRGKNTVNLLQPENLLMSHINKLGADVGVLVAYGKIVPQEIIDIFPKGIVAAHPSLLPKYRGATPIQAAISNGDDETGTTLFLMDEKIDHGHIIEHTKVDIAYNETYEMLTRKLAETSADLIIKTLPRYLRGEIQPRAQDEARASYTKKLTSADGYIHPASLQAAMSGEAISEAQRIWRMVRALNPEPGVWTITNKDLLSSFSSMRGNLNTRVKLLAAEYTDGKLLLTKIQFAGGQVMTISQKN